MDQWKLENFGASEMVKTTRGGICRLRSGLCVNALH